MTQYRNLSGKSNIISYETTDDSILVVFASGNHRNYLYNRIRPGKAIVDKMKALAEQGYGLNTYINKTVQESYAQKW